MLNAANAGEPQDLAEVNDSSQSVVEKERNRISIGAVLEMPQHDAVRASTSVPTMMSTACHGVSVA